LLLILKFLGAYMKDQKPEEDQLKIHDERTFLKDD
jgi:hypothetical protein